MIRGRFASAVVLRAAPSCAAVAACGSFAVAAMPAAARAAAPAMTIAIAAPAMTAFRFGGEAPKEPPSFKKQGAYLLDKADVLQRVTEVVKNFEKVDASKVTPESHFINDLGLDSLDVVEVVMALEQEFVLDIPDHEAEKIQSIPDAVEYLCANPMAK